MGIIVLVPIALPGLARWRNLISIVGVLMAPLLLDVAVKQWKERVTFPRGGYVQFRPPSGTMRLTMVIIAGILGATAMLLARFRMHHALPDLMGPIMGFVISLTLLQLAWRMRSVRLAVLCWLVLAAGITVLIAGVPRDSQMIYVFLAAGVVCVLDGGLRLRSFQHEHPLPEGEQS